MASPVLMPKQGQTVESCIIVSWKKKKGDAIKEGETLCEVETDKAVMEVVSPASGTVLDLFAEEGDVVPVLVNIAAIGSAGEDVSSMNPNSNSGSKVDVSASPASKNSDVNTSKSNGTSHSQNSSDSVSPPSAQSQNHSTASTENFSANNGISPRAKNLAQQKGLPLDGIAGSGPEGRIIERDIQAQLESQANLSPSAKAALGTGDLRAPAYGSGVGARIMTGDLQTAGVTEKNPGQASAFIQTPDEFETIPVKGIRKLIADRMLQSLQTTAQLTLNASADARALQTARKQFKDSAESLGLRKITLNDMVLFAVSRTLPRFPMMNALYESGNIKQYRNIHLGFAVDTPRGLMVPVIRNVQNRTLLNLSHEAKRLAEACMKGSVSPDELNGGTFTISNLGNLGIESFTPVLNPPQVGILGIGSISLKAVEVNDEVQFVPHLGLSLTINHQVVDGAPAAQFLKSFSDAVAEFGTLMAI